MKLVKFIGILFILFGLVCSSIGIGFTENGSVEARSVKAGTFDSSKWQYRQNFTIKGSPDGVLTNYQMKLIVHKGAGKSNGSDVYLNNHCKDDFSDITFAKADGITLLNYWVENISSGNTAIVWVKLDSIPASTDSASFYIYYGNDSAFSSSNGSNTFIFFDDFSDCNITDWHIVQGTWTAASGYLKVTSNGVPDQIENIRTIPSQFRYMVQCAGAGDGAVVSEIAYGSRASSYILYRYNWGQDFDFWLGYTKLADATFTPNHDAHWQEFTRGASGDFKTYYDNTLKSSVNNTAVTSFDRLSVEAHAAVNSIFYKVILANFTTNEPALGTWGSEEKLEESYKLNGTKIGLLSFGLVLILLGIIVLFKRQAKLVVSGATAVVEKVKLTPMRTKGLIMLAAGAIVVITAIILIFI